MSRVETLEFGGVPSTWPLSQNSLWVLWELIEKHESMRHEKSAAVWMLFVGEKQQQHSLNYGFMRCADMAVMCQMQYAIHASKNTLLKRMRGTPFNQSIATYCSKFLDTMRKINFFETISTIFQHNSLFKRKPSSTICLARQLHS